MACLMRDAEKAFMDHAWIPLGYPAGMKGWAMYCADHFRQVRQLAKEERIRLFREAGPTILSGRAAAAVIGVNATAIIRG